MCPHFHLRVSNTGNGAGGTEICEGAAVPTVMNEPNLILDETLDVSRSDTFSFHCCAGLAHARAVSPGGVSPAIRGLPSPGATAPRCAQRTLSSEILDFETLCVQDDPCRNRPGSSRLHTFVRRLPQDCDPHRSLPTLSMSARCPSWIPARRAGVRKGESIWEWVAAFAPSVCLANSPSLGPSPVHRLSTASPRAEGRARVSVPACRRPAFAFHIKRGCIAEFDLSRSTIQPLPHGAGLPASVSAVAWLPLPITFQSAPPALGRQPHVNPPPRHHGAEQSREGQFYPEQPSSIWPPQPGLPKVPTGV